VPFGYWHLGDGAKDSTRAVGRDGVARLTQEVPGLRGVAGLDAISLGNLHPEVQGSAWLPSWFTTRHCSTLASP
jgi:hypothetical protein